MSRYLRQSSVPKLSICITTLNRARYLRDTIQSIVTQLTDDCELVILDAASSDDTENVVSQHEPPCDRLRYFRQDTNNGVDRDYDRAVELARGQYCWLMTDDDLLVPGAVATVLQAISIQFSLMIVNWKVMTVDMSQLLKPRFLEFEEDRVYGPSERDRLFVELRGALMYIGCVVIERATWLARERTRYYGSMYIHVGVIFQSLLPKSALVLAEPLISYRMSASHTWSTTVFETAVIKWWVLVWSLPISESVKVTVCGTRPWIKDSALLTWRALGFYSIVEFRQWIRPRTRSISESVVPALIAVFPGVLLNILFVLYYSVSRRPQSALILQFLRDSRFYVRLA